MPGEPSPVRRILIQEVSAHPEIRQRALELHSRVVASVAGYLAEATGGVCTPEHGGWEPSACRAAR